MGSTSGQHTGSEGAGRCIDGRPTHGSATHNVSPDSRFPFVAGNVLGLQATSVTDRVANGTGRIDRNTRPLRDAEGVAFA